MRVQSGQRPGPLCGSPHLVHGLRIGVSLIFESGESDDVVTHQADSEFGAKLRDEVGEDFEQGEDELRGSAFVDCFLECGVDAVDVVAAVVDDEG